MSHEAGKGALIPEKKEWNAESYDARHSFVWKYGAEVIELLAPRKGERILDLGCGTGHLTHRISRSGAKVIGLDRSPDMIERARTAYPELQFVLADANDFRFPEPFDAVFSNAALHWMRQPAQVAASIARALKPGGRFVAEFGGKGNLARLHAALKRAMEAAGSPLDDGLSPWYFPSIGEYAALLEQHHLAVTWASLFDRPTRLEHGERGLREWLETFASNFLARLTPAQQEQCCNNIEEQLRPALFRNGDWYADYKRIRIAAVRE